MLPRHPLVLVPAFVLVVACGGREREAFADSSAPAAVAPAADPAAEVRALFLDQTSSWNAGDPEPTIAALADDVIQMQPDTVHRGKAALSKAWRAYFAANTPTWTPTVVSAAARGDMAFIKATFTESATPKAGGATTTESALAFEVYRKDAEGKWKLVLESWYPDPLVVPSSITGYGPSTPAADSVRAAFEAYAKGWTTDVVEPAIAMLHDDVVQLSPNSTYVGKEALAVSWRETFKAQDYKWSPTVLDIQVSGDLAFVRYTGLETLTPRAGGPTRRVSSSGWDVFRRDGAGGGWKLIGETWFVAK